jgi:glucose/arabinose dehydrogenase
MEEAMRKPRPALLAAALAVAVSIAFAEPVSRMDTMLTGSAAYSDWRSDAPGIRRKITDHDLPAPLANAPVANPPTVVKRPDGTSPKVPAGFSAELFASGLAGPRVIRVAPNGDIFVAESEGGRVHAMRTADAAKPAQFSVFASGLDAPFGIAFYPPGRDPHFLYLATTTKILRFAYQSGDLKASGKAEVVVQGLPSGGHSTRDLAFSPDGKTMFVSVGSLTNDAEGSPPMTSASLKAFEKTHGRGASWGSETDRADVLAFDPDGRNKRVYATGLRNCSGLTIEPESGELWCVVNERDLLGDDLPPDYATSVKEGGFYGWPWYYIGEHADPHQKRSRGDLSGKITVPDVLIQPHSAPLGIAFYEGAQFPATYKGNAFVALHGSWNRRQRTGYKVICLIFNHGKPTGEYEDFLVGFVVNDASVWARPVDIAVAHDGSLLVTEDGNGTIWRVSYTAGQAP